MANHAADARLGPAKKLRLVDAVAQSVGFMGPVFSIAFLVPLIMGITSASGNGAGAAAPLAVLVAAIGVLAVGWIVAQYARRIHAAGAIYDYVTEGMGSRVGGAAGFLYYAGILSMCCATLMILGGTIHDTLLAEFGGAGLPEIGWHIVLVLIVAVFLIRGVAISTRAQLVLALISMAVVFIFFVYVAFKVGFSGDVVKAFTPSGSGQGLTGIVFGVAYGVILFGGFESAANLAEETEDPGRNIPKAIIFSVLTVTGFYLVCSYAQVAGFGFSVNAFSEAAGAPLFALASPAEAGGFGSVTLVRMMELVVILDMIAVLIGVSTAASRGLFAMARDGRLPRVATRVGTYGTPVGAAGIIVAILVVALLVNRFAPSLWAVPGLPHYLGMFAVFATLGALAFVCVYFLLSLGALRGLADHRHRGRVIAAAAVGMTVTAGAVFGGLYKAPTLTVEVHVFGLAVFLVGFLVRGRVRQVAPEAAVAVPAS